MPAEQHFCVPPCIFVPDKELDCLTHVKLNSLDDMQELLNDSHHKIAFDNYEDTTTLVEDPTLTTAETLLPKNSDSSAGNGPIAFEYYCYEIETDAPQFNYDGPKIMIPKQELPVTICTTDTIGTIRSQRHFQVLLDSGSYISMIKRSALPKGVITKLLGDTNLVRTLAGCLKTQEVITMQGLRLPKFDKNRHINQQQVLVFNNKQQQHQIQHNSRFKLSFQNRNQVELLRKKI
jgi:hypothetical protein